MSHAAGPLRSVSERGTEVRSSASRRRVVHLTSAHPAFDMRIFRKECQSLARAGYTVTLVVPHEANTVQGGVRIEAVRRPSGRVTRFTRTLWDVYQKAVSLDSDLYHLHDPELIPLGFLLRMRGYTVVLDIHEDLPAQIRSKDWIPEPLRPMVSRAAALAEWLAVRAFHGVIAATAAVYQRYRAIGPGQARLVQNYPILGELEAPDETPHAARPRTILYVGGISEIRGIRELVRAMSLVKDDGVSLRLGGTFMPAGLESEIRSEPGWKRVRYIGWVERNTYAQELGNARAGAVLFQPEPNHVASQPNKLYEYMSAGLPVIASDFPLWREIVEGVGCGVLVDPTDPSAIAEAIDWVLCHPGQAEEMGRAGRAAVEHRFNWALQESELLNLYEELLE